MSVAHKLPKLGKTHIAVAILLVGYARLAAKRTPNAATFQVKREEFLEVLQFRGQVKAMRSVTISAPAQAGNLEVLKIVASG